MRLALVLILEVLSTTAAGTSRPVFDPNLNPRASVERRGIDVPGGWSALGPYSADNSGGVGAFAVDDSGTTYIAAAAGVFRSPDSMTWTRVSAGLGLYFDQVRAMVSSPTSPGVLLVGTCGAGIYRTRDAGQTWAPAGTGLPRDACVQVMARSGGVIYLGLRLGLYESFDEGSSWTLLDRGLGQTSVTSIGFDPVDRSVLYVGTYTLGVFKSGDGGSSWRQTGLTTEGDARYPGIYAIAVAPSDPRVVYAGSFRATFRSDDRGISWTVLPPRSTHPSTGDNFGGSTALGVDPRFPSTVYALDDQGSWRTADGGLTWSQLELSGTSNLTAAIRVSPAPGNPITVSGAFGLSQSLDEGNTWQTLTPGYRPVGVSRIVGLPKGSRIYAVPYFEPPPGSLYVTDDAGATWTRLKIPSLPSDVALDPTNEQVLYLSSGDRLYKTVDGGKTFQPASSGLPTGYDGYVSALTVDPLHPDQVFAGVWFLTPQGYIGRVYASTDGGAHWSATALDVLMTAMVFDPRNSSVRYVSSLDKGISKSVDSGSTWTPADSGLTRPFVVQLAIDPWSPSTLYAAFDIVSRSSDEAESWSLISSGLFLNDATSLHADTLRPSTVYLTDNSGIFRLDGRDDHWTEITPRYPLDVFPGNPYLGSGWEDTLSVGSPSGPALYSAHYLLGVFRQELTPRRSPRELPSE